MSAVANREHKGAQHTTGLQIDIFEGTAVKLPPTIRVTVTKHKTLCQLEYNDIMT